MKGVIGFEFDENGHLVIDSAVDRYTTEVKPTVLEKEAMELIYTAVGDLADKIKPYARTDNYLTLCGEEYQDDFCRIKATDRAKWISLDMDGSPFRDDPRLSFVKNKNQRHWKIQLFEIKDITDYADIIQASAEEVLINRKK